MTVSNQTLKDRLKYPEDQFWEFKQIELKDGRLARPAKNTLAKELIAFANASGGYLLLGVTDKRDIQDFSANQLESLGDLVSEVASDSIEPPLRIAPYIRSVDGKALWVIEVPKGDALHELEGRSWIRVGTGKRQMTSQERMRLAQLRSQARFIWFDGQVMPETGFNTLAEPLWIPLLSGVDAHDPVGSLRKSRLLIVDENGAERATVAGVLLCTLDPQEHIPHAVIRAACYRGLHSDSQQLDDQAIGGPLHHQIRDAMKFVSRNMRVGARRTPMRENLPQYSLTAVFEAVTNAVAHRDYSIKSQRIRLSMYSNRIEIDSPGSLPNGLTVDTMEAAQSTRNDVISAILGRLVTKDIPGAGHRTYIMETRGHGVRLIKQRTKELSGSYPVYNAYNDINLVLAIPAARVFPTPANAAIAVHADGEPLADVKVVAFFPNNTSVQETTDAAGEATLDLHSTHLPMTVFAAAPGYAAGLEKEWVPRERELVIELERLEFGGSTVFSDKGGRLPELKGRLNPIRDNLDRTYLYAINIAIDRGRPQPVQFRFGKALRLTDSLGAEMRLTVVDLIGGAALVEYQHLIN